MRDNIEENLKKEDKDYIKESIEEIIYPYDFTSNRYIEFINEYDKNELADYVTNLLNSYYPLESEVISYIDIDNNYIDISIYEGYKFLNEDGFYLNQKEMSKCSKSELYLAREYVEHLISEEPDNPNNSYIDLLEELKTCQKNKQWDIEL